MIDIGDVLNSHELTLRISGKNISLWDNGKIVLDDYNLPYVTEGYGFGPITSHTNHDCEQISFFNFSNIEMFVTSES